MRRCSHGRLRRRALIASIAAAALMLTGCEFDGAYDLPLPGSPVNEDNSFEITAEFADVLNVVPRSVVMVDDVTVGEVTDVERVGWNAVLTMRVREGTTLPDNAFAEIRQTSLLGEKYVALEAPLDEDPIGQLSDGDDIPVSATGRNPEVEEVLGALSFLLSGGGVGQLGTITQELNNVMSGRTGRLNHLLGSLESVIGTLDDQKVEIISAMESLNGLAKTLNAEKRTIGEALDVLPTAVDVLAAQHDELIDMLESLDELGRVGTRVIGASKDDLIATLRNLRPVLTKLGDAGDQLATGLDMMVSFPFPKEAANVVQGDYANASIRAGINLSIVGDPGGGPDNPLPEIPVPDPEDVLNQIQKCLASGDLTSKACQKVLSDADQYKKLKKACKKPKNQDNEVCVLLNTLPDDEDDDGLPDIPGLPDLPGVFGAFDAGLLGLDDAFTSGRSMPSYTVAALVGGGT